MPPFPEKVSFFLSACEPSGERIACQLANKLQSLSPYAKPLSLFGIGGQALSAAGVELLFPMHELAIMGFSQVFLNLYTIFKRMKEAETAILTRLPQAVIFVDAPDFHLRLAKRLRKKGYTGRIIQYVSPTIWAWRPKRLKTLVQYYDLVLSIYPFEPKLFAQTSLPCLYVGNPVQEEIDCLQSRQRAENPFPLEKIEALDLPQRPLVGIFPGSRRAEIQSNLPLLFAAFMQFQQKHPQSALVISSAHSQAYSIIKQALPPSLKLNADVFIVPSKFNAQLMPKLQVALTKSGTISLELALYQVPSVVIYQTSWLNRFIARYLFRIRLPYFSLPNILLEKEVFPELIAEPPTSEALASMLSSLYSDSSKREQCLSDCREICRLLEKKEASTSSAEAIWRLVNE